MCGCVCDKGESYNNLVLLGTLCFSFILFFLKSNLFVLYFFFFTISQFHVILRLFPQNLSYHKPKLDRLSPILQTATAILPVIASGLPIPITTAFAVL